MLQISHLPCYIENIFTVLLSMLPAYKNVFFNRKKMRRKRRWKRRRVPQTGELSLSFCVDLKALRALVSVINDLLRSCS